MTGKTWVLLPGLDGSGLLFEEFVRYRPQADVGIVRYPLDPSWRLDDYVDHVEATIAAVSPCVVVAESFSGPIALRLQRRNRRVAGVVLAASFVERPNPLLGLVPLESIGARWQHALTSMALVRLMCLDFHASAGLASAVQRVVRALPIEVVRSRLRLLRDLDERATLESLDVPWLALVPRSDRLVPFSAFPAGGLGEVASIDGPHFLLQARPEACWRSIEAWSAARLSGI
jgi:pimeloyl-ACP methyl ester carboxylesterase